VVGSLLACSSLTCCLGVLAYSVGGGAGVESGEGGEIKACLCLIVFDRAPAP
jgi:hypothetical protein